MCNVDITSKKVKYITNFPFDSKLVSQLNQINSQDAPQLTNANFKIKGEILSSYFQIFIMHIFL